MAQFLTGSLNFDSPVTENVNKILWTKYNNCSQKTNHKMFVF